MPELETDHEDRIAEHCPRPAVSPHLMLWSQICSPVGSSGPTYEPSCEIGRPPRSVSGVHQLDDAFKYAIMLS
jgi:hypothetical protein